MAGRFNARDLLIPAAVIAAVGMMIFPLPLFVLDILLACNVAFALALLVNSLYVRDAEHFTALPTMLLLATLFRLGLNVSTTRQILAYGTAPDIITAFGEFVVHGNLVVGLVVFIIVTIVQFLVIAKGAERVAEVSARFTLDAMPGKQMAIDADMRAGFLSAHEAKEKRLELQRESKLYGALDGAMKFVKGDAIAGLLITVINISAGFIIGVTHHNLNFGEAISRFTLYTVGDGLVSQIPALLVSVAAGVVVTQVSDKEGMFLSGNILKQLCREPQALYSVGVILGLLAFAPGLPAAPFFAGFVIFFGAASSKAAADREFEIQSRETEFLPKRYVGFVLRMNSAVTAKLAEDSIMPKKVRAFRSRAFERWGLFIPDVSFDIDDAMPEEELHIYLGSICIAKLNSNSDSYLGDSVVSTLTKYVEAKRSHFVNDTHVRKLIELHASEIEDMANDLIPEVVTVTELSSILANLLDDGIPIKEFGKILQGVANHSRGIAPRDNAETSLYFKEKGRTNLLSGVRVALKREITEIAKDREGRVRAWLIAPRLDSLLNEAYEANKAIYDKLIDKFIEAAAESIGNETGAECVLMTSGASREIVRASLRAAGISLRVVACDELENDVPFEVLGDIGAELESDEGQPELLQ